MNVEKQTIVQYSHRFEKLTLNKDLEKSCLKLFNLAVFYAICLDDIFERNSIIEWRRMTLESRSHLKKEL